jgi:hypothetical protein
LGDTVILYASGAQTYSWNTGQTSDTIVVTSPGTYSVTGFTPGVCPGTTQFTIPAGTIPNVVASAPISTMCLNTPSFLLNGSPPGGIWSGPGIALNFFNPATAGVGIHEIIYTVFDSVTCYGSDTIKMTVNLCTGLEENNESGVVLYPNPATDQITLVLTDKQTQATRIELYNVYGQKVMDIFDGKIEQPHWEQFIDISKLNDGIYIFKINGAAMQKAVFVK